MIRHQDGQVIARSARVQPGRDCSGVRKRQLNQLLGMIICALLFRFGAERTVPIAIVISRVPDEDVAI